MTDSEMKTMLSTITEEEDDAILSTYLEIAKDVTIRHLYPFDSTQTEVPSPYHIDCVRIGAYLLNKRGAEGERSHSEGGIARVYEDGDIPPSLLRRLIPYGQVPGGRADEDDV